MLSTSNLIFKTTKRYLTTNTMTKTVAVIGAGPSGLVAAKTLTHNVPPNTFHVTILEKSSRIGGLWPLSKDSKESDGGVDMVNPDMCTNQSRHTVAFSDFAWGENEKAFPRAWEVGRYLEGYWGAYGAGVDLRLGCGVESVRRNGDGWSITVKGNGGKEEVRDFDYVLIATGFFGKEKVPSMLNVTKNVPVMHSSKVRDVRDLITNDGQRDLESVKERNIVVVGGQMSGIETAAHVALQISSLANSPGNEMEAKEWGRWTVTNVVARPVWILPLFFPKNPEVEVEEEGGKKVKKTNSSPDFLPLDLVNYNLEWRPPGPVQNSSGHVSKEGGHFVHGFMNTYLGTDQTEYGAPVLGMKGDEVRDEPPMLACSDYYTEFVRAGKIRVVQGRMKDIFRDGLSIEVEGASGNSDQISDVAAIISATGFDASPSLDFLPEELLQTLQFKPDDDAFPLALNVHSTINHTIPSLGFVGFYRSPYWGVMEMQARYLAKLWTGDTQAQQALAEDKTKDAMLALRTDPRRAQFPMGDYTYLMEVFSTILNIERQEPSDPGARTGIVLPQRYLPSDSSPEQVQQAQTALSIIKNTFTSSSESGTYSPRATFRALQGTWKLSRTITSQLSTFPSGTLSGTASFNPRFPTPPNETADMEYLYLEEGEFRPSWGGVMIAKRSYVYCYEEKEDKITVWFTKGDGRSVDYYFHEVRFVVGEEKKVGSGWMAKNEHLCIEDLYNVEYEFFFRGTVIDRWTSRYIVKGPKKDYTIENLYTRP